MYVISPHIAHRWAVFTLATTTSTLAGCTLANAHPWALDTADTADTGALDDTTPCDPYYGFSAEGTVWDWQVSTLAMEGWERVELTWMNPETGEVQTRTTGEHDFIAFTYTFDRTDDWICGTTGLYQVGWTSTWQVQSPDGVLSRSGVNTVLWDTPMRNLTASPEVGDSWWYYGTTTITNELGEVFTQDVVSERVIRIQAEEEIDTVLGTISALRVDQYHGPSIWWAQDYGVVKRSGMTLIGYTPGTP